MNSIMPPEELTKLCDEIEALLKEASPRPWRNAHGDIEDSDGSCIAPEVDDADLVVAISNAAQTLIDAARESVRYTRLSESRESLGDALDLREENAELRAELDTVRNERDEAYERAARVVIDSPTFFTTKNRHGLAEAIRALKEKP